VARPNVACSQSAMVACRMSHVALGTAFPALCLVLLTALIGHLGWNEYCPGPYISSKEAGLFKLRP